MKRKTEGIWDFCSYCGIGKLITSSYFKKGRRSNVTGEVLKPGEWICNECDNKNDINNMED